MAQTIEYEIMPQGKVLEAYDKCRERVSFIRGPLGSGKTTQTILKILDLMCEQEPVNRPGHRHHKTRLTRIIAVRNTYSDLLSTTVKDWLEIHGELGTFKAGSKEPPTHHIKFSLPDGTKVKSEIIFIAFDRPDHIRKARGIQATWIWLNEIKELVKPVVDILDLRHGRYPSKKEGVECTQHGMLGDTNSPDTDHWYYELAEEIKPDGWVFFSQPGGVTGEAGDWKINPLAENLGNLPANYYKNGLGGKKDDWIKVNFANEYGFVIDGKPVHPFYVDSTHCVDMKDWKPKLDKVIVLGFDFGRTPACAIMQKVEPYNRWVVFDEFTSNNVSATSFAPALKNYLESEYPGHEFRGWGDPAGDSKGQATDDTPFQILQGAGITAYPTVDNKPLMRRGAVEQPLRELCMDGKPRLIILPKAKMIRKGLQGGFCYRRIMVSGEKYSEEPDKNEYSHPVEALEYGLYGEGEGREMVRVKDSRFNQKPAQMGMDFSVFE